MIYSSFLLNNFYINYFYYYFLIYIYNLYLCLCLYLILLTLNDLNDYTQIVYLLHFI